MTFGEKIKMLREQRGWTQSQLADKLDISSQVVSNYERDYRFPDKETLNKIADLFVTSLDYLLGRKDESYKQQIELGKKALTKSVNASRKVDELYNESFEALLQNICIGDLVYDPFREELIEIANIFKDTIYKDIFKFKDEIRTLFYLSAYKHEIINLLVYFQVELNSPGRLNIDIFFSSDESYGNSIQSKKSKVDFYRNLVEKTKNGEYVENISPLKPFFYSIKYIQKFGDNEYEKRKLLAIQDRLNNHFSDNNQNEKVNLMSQLERFREIAVNVEESKPIYPQNGAFFDGKFETITQDEADRLKDDLEMYRLLKAKREKENKK